jgi:hypothetical protein
MGLRQLAGIVLPQLPEPSTCEACGETFVCGATLTGCWCSEIKLSEAIRAQLRSRYNRCLCRACLESFAKSEGDNASPLD